MAKKFNITGNCIPHKHYMADISGKVAQVLAMVEEGEYLAISRPRQYGKTTMLRLIGDALGQKEGYLAIQISLEGIGDKVFSDEAQFCPAFVRLLAKWVGLEAPARADWLMERLPEASTLEALSNLVTEFVQHTGCRVVLCIDEVDKSSNNQLFISFLGMLRDKYLLREWFPTFHSVILAGVHDVKTLKAKLRPDDEAKQNSPWNIAAEFTVSMSLRPDEIAPMLADYAHEQGVALDAPALAERLHYYTSGHPFLVSRLCKTVAEDILPGKAEQAWGEQELTQAVQLLLRARNTNFDSLIKNLENDTALYDLTFSLIMDGAVVAYSQDNPLIQKGVLHGIFAKNGSLKVQNRIYEQRIYEYMASKMETTLSARGRTQTGQFQRPDNSLDLEAALLKFQSYLKEQYSAKDRVFLERQWRLVFLAFLRPILNGRGYDFKEVQVSEERRLDIVLTHYHHKYVVELKVWAGPKAHRAGLAQLAGYLEGQGLDEGYLVVFDKRTRSKSWASEWVEVQGKRVFTIWV